MPQLETCENCGRAIGKLETAHLHQDHVVCKECKRQLAAQPLAYATPTPAVEITPIAPPAKGISGFGVAALVLGIIAAVFCWVPFLGLLSLPVAGIGLALALVGLLVSLIGRRSSIGMPVAGGALCALAMFLAITSTAALTSGIAQVQQQNAQRQAAREAQSAQVPEPREQAAPTSRGAAIAAIARATRSARSAPPARSPAPAPPAIAWADARLPAQVGDAEVRVSAVKLGKVSAKDAMDRTRESEDDCLQVTIQVRNNSATRKLNYRSLGDRSFRLSGESETMEDELGNHYRAVNFGFGSTPIGRTNEASIYPGQSISDVLIFEPPVPAASKLRLVLPAKSFDADGVVRFEIAASMIQR